jgi:ketosteroid isomerase-like protein
MKHLLMASICILGLSGSAFAIDTNTDKTVREAAQAWETLANKGDVTTLATHYTSDAIRVTPAGAFYGRDAIAKDLTETNKIFKNITIKTNKVEGTEKGTIFCDGEWTGDMQTQDGKVMPVKGLWGVTGEIQGGKFLHLMDVYTMAPANQ